MSSPLFDRGRLRFRPLAERRNKVRIQADHVSPDLRPAGLSPEARLRVSEAAAAVRSARAAGRAAILAFGAHAIKNGLGPVLIRLAEAAGSPTWPPTGPGSSTTGSSPIRGPAPRTCARTWRGGSSDSGRRPACT
jgi:hypothetical protein